MAYIAILQNNSVNNCIVLVYLVTLRGYFGKNMFIYVDSCDTNNNAAIIGAIVGVDCTVIIIMVITNILVWIYCFRRRHYAGMHGYPLVNEIQFISM